jgi:hypothetical protein
LPKGFKGEFILFFSVIYYNGLSLRYVSVALGAVAIGYTLQPIPKVLDDLFKGSQGFKLIWMTIFILNVMGKLSVQHVAVALFVSAAVLSLFEYLRVQEQKTAVKLN